MKRNHSNSRRTFNSHQQVQGGDSRCVPATKNKTVSTIVHTEHEPQQQTTKKNSITRVGSCAKMGSSSKSSRSNLLKIEPRVIAGSKIAGPSADLQGLALKNEQLINENKVLRDEYCKLQENHLKDKAKIQLLIGRMSQIRSEHQENRPGAPADNQQCSDSQCCEKRRKMQMQLHRERIKVYELEQEKKKWEKSKEQLKGQYRDLLSQIQGLRERQ